MSEYRTKKLQIVIQNTQFDPQNLKKRETFLKNDYIFHMEKIYYITRLQRIFVLLSCYLDEIPTFKLNYKLSLIIFLYALKKNGIDIFLCRRPADTQTRAAQSEKYKHIVMIVLLDGISKRCAHVDLIRYLICLEREQSQI